MNTLPTQIDSTGGSDPWVQRLESEDDDVRDAALAELQSILERGLRNPMQQRYGGRLQPEDVVQDALMKILDSLDQFAGRSKFTTWAMTIAMRVGISEMRRKHYRNVSLDGFGDEEMNRIEIAVDESTNAHFSSDRQSILAKLQSAIETELTQKQRLAIRSQLDGLPVEVIAEKVGGNRNSIYKLIHDARVKLRKALEKAGVVADDMVAVFATTGGS